MLINKTYLKISGTIFAIVGFLHLLRFFMGYEVILAGWQVPMWFSLVGAIALWYLAYNSYKLFSK